MTANNQWPWYELKYELSEFIVEKLNIYKENYNKNGYSIPTWLQEKPQETFTDSEILELQERWNIVLDKMIDAFKQVLNYKLSFKEDDEYDEVKIQEGLDLFSKYFIHFWD